MNVSRAALTELVATIKAIPGVVSAVGARVYSYPAVSEPRYPLVTVDVVGAEAERTIGGLGGMDIEVAVSVIGRAETTDDLAELADTIEGALEGVQIISGGNAVFRVWKTGDAAEPELIGSGRYVSLTARYLMRYQGEA